MKRKYIIKFEVYGDPVSTDKLLRIVHKKMKSRLRPLKKGEDWRDIIYKEGTDEWVSKKKKLRKVI